MKQLLFVGASIMLFAASCTKSSTSAVANQEILTVGKWRTTAYYVKFEIAPGVDSVFDIYKNWDTCRSDDYITFAANYKGVEHSGGLKCSSELDDNTIEWELRSNQSVLMLNNAIYTTGKEYVEAKITKINQKSFTITYSKEGQFALPTVPITYKDVTFYYTHTFTK